MSLRERKKSWSIWLITVLRVKNKYAISMVATPKKKQRKQRTKKQNQQVEDKTIGELFPKVTTQTLDQLQNFYKIGLSATLTSTQPGMPGRETTRRIFLYLDDEMLKDYDMDANNRQKLAKQRNKSSFERILLKLEIQMAKVEKALESVWSEWEDKNAALKKLEPPGKTKPFDLDIKAERLKINLTTSIAEVRDHIATTDYTLTIDESDEAAILKHMEAKMVKLSA